MADWKLERMVSGTCRCGARVITNPQYAKDLAESIARLRMLALVEFISTLQAK